MDYFIGGGISRLSPFFVTENYIYFF